MSNIENAWAGCQAYGCQVYGKDAEIARLKEVLTEISNQAGDPYDDDENNASLLALITRLADTVLQPRAK